MQGKAERSGTRQAIPRAASKRRWAPALAARGAGCGLPAAAWAGSSSQPARPQPAPAAALPELGGLQALAGGSQGRARRAVGPPPCVFRPAALLPHREAQGGPAPRPPPRARLCRAAGGPPGSRHQQRGPGASSSRLWPPQGQRPEVAAAGAPRASRVAVTRALREAAEAVAAA